MTTLVDVSVRLHDAELDTVREFAERILFGQQAYGPVTKGKKRWNKEAKEELLDAAFYGLRAVLEEDEAE